MGKLSTVNILTREITPLLVCIILATAWGIAVNYSFLNSGGRPDLLRVMKSAEDVFLWLVANTSIERKRSLIDVIFEVSLDEIPYVGKPFRHFYQHLRDR